MKKPNIVGTKVNAWFIVSRAVSGVRSGYLCRCECGFEIFKNRTELFAGRAKRCRNCLDTNVAHADEKRLSLMLRRRELVLSKGNFIGCYAMRGQYAVRLTYNGKKFFLGYHDDIYEAAKAYDKKCFEIYGEPSVLNFPEDYYEAA